MPIFLLSKESHFNLYHVWSLTYPHSNLWQSLHWKYYQEALGREVRIYVDFNPEYKKLDVSPFSATAMVIIDKTKGGYSTWDIPRGPIGQSNSLLQTIINDAKKGKCISIFLSPVTGHWLPAIGRPSGRHEQPEATRIIDLIQSEEDILKQMHPKGRYNIKLAEKSGVKIKHCLFIDEVVEEDIEAYEKLASETAKRDGFTGGSTKRYAAFLAHIPGSFLLLAYAPDHAEPIAGLIGVHDVGRTGIYYYGASDYHYRAMMAPYLLQWEAIKMCKKAGSTRYDLLGIAPPDQLHHPWSGISDFKAKFGGTVVTYPPEQEIVLKPVMKRLLQMKRRIMG